MIRLYILFHIFLAPAVMGVIFFLAFDSEVLHYIWSIYYLIGEVTARAQQ